MKKLEILTAADGGGSAHARKLSKTLLGGGLGLLLGFALAGPAAAALQIQGSVQMPGQAQGDIVVNPNTDRLYVSGGIAQNFMTVIDVSDPTNPNIVTTIGVCEGGSGVAVNPSTNRFYTSNGFGGLVLVYDGATNGFIKSLFIGACPGSFDIDVTTNLPGGLIYVTRQCAGGGPPLGVDPFFVIDGTTDTLLTPPPGIGTGGVVGSIRVNSATGKAYPCASVGPPIFGPAPTFSLLGFLPGECVLTINPVTNRLYTQSGSNTNVRDGTTETTVIATIPGVFGRAVNTNLNRVYALDQPNNAIKVIDGATNTVIETFVLPAGLVPSSGVMTVDSSKNRLFVFAFDSGAPTLLVIDDVPQVAIDIKPGSVPNSINQGSGGVIPVAILGSATFDATTVDGSTCTLGGAIVKIAGKSDKLLCSVEDVSGPPPGPGGATDPSGVPDGFLDQVCKFVTVDLGAAMGDTTATIACTSPVFQATDSIRLVPPE